MRCRLDDTSQSDGMNTDEANRQFKRARFLNVLPHGCAMFVCDLMVHWYRSIRKDRARARSWSALGAALRLHRTFEGVRRAFSRAEVKPSANRRGMRVGKLAVAMLRLDEGQSVRWRAGNRPPSMN